MKTRKITLLDTVDYNGMTITHIVLREPTAAEYMEHGEVYMRTVTDGGQTVVVESDGAIAAYAALLIAEPASLPLDRVSLADGMRLKDAVLDFFGAAQRLGSPQERPASSTASAGSELAISADPA